MKKRIRKKIFKRAIKKLTTGQPLTNQETSVVKKDFLAKFITAGRVMQHSLWRISSALRQSAGYMRRYEEEVRKRGKAN